MRPVNLKGTCIFLFYGVFLTHRHCFYTCRNVTNIYAHLCLGNIITSEAPVADLHTISWEKDLQYVVGITINGRHGVSLAESTTTDAIIGL